MIPKKRKTAEEIAALREGLGIPEFIPQPGVTRQRPLPVSPLESTREHNNPAPISENTTVEKRQRASTQARGKSAPEKNVIKPEAPHLPLPVLDPAHSDQITTATVLSPPDEEIVHLDVPDAASASPAKIESPQVHSLRKNELPLAPAPAVTQKTALPAHRHALKDIEEIRRREAIGHLSSNAQDPAAHLRSITAHPVLIIFSYLVALGAAVAASQRVHPITPLALIALSIALTIYIFIKKKRSRHHAAFLIIIIIMTLVFGGLHYAPLFNYGP